MDEQQNGSSSGGGPPPGMSDVEWRRQERRRKILQNQESRLQRITGPSEAASENEAQPVPVRRVIPPVAAVDEASQDYPLFEDNNDLNDYAILRNQNEQQRAQPQGKMPVWIHRLVLCALGILLPIVDVNCFILYFLTYQLAVFRLFKGLQTKQTSPNLLITLILVMGLTEHQVFKFQQLIRILSGLWADFCLFIMSTALSQVALKSLISPTSQSE